MVPSKWLPGSHPAASLIAAQRCRDLAGTGKFRGQDSGVLDRLVRALTIVREHRVRCVAQQHHRPPAPASEWPAREQAPSGRLWYSTDHLDDCRVPARERRKVRAGLASLHPSWPAPFFWSLDDREKVDHRAAADGVMQQARTRADPELQRAGLGQARQQFDRDEWRGDHELCEYGGGIHDKLRE